MERWSTSRSKIFLPGVYTRRLSSVTSFRSPPTSCSVTTGRSSVFPGFTPMSARIGPTGDAYRTPNPGVIARRRLWQRRVDFLSDDSAVHERGSGKRAPDREPRLDASLEDEIAAERARVEIAGRELRRIGIAFRDVSARYARRVEAVVFLERLRRNGQHARPELILAEAAHRVRSAGVESLSRMKACCSLFVLHSHSLAVLPSGLTQPMRTCAPIAPRFRT